jgi:hypothetical protein
MVRPDETMIIDREEEVSRFERMVVGTAPHRIMVVSNRSGMGKTDLLRKFRLHCSRDYTVPVALAYLSEFQQKQDEFAVVECLYKALVRTGASLPSFQRLDNARGFRNTVAFMDSLSSMSGFVDLSGASISGQASVAGVEINVQTLILNDWSEAADAKARDLCVAAFLYDLREYSREHTVVLLIDGLDEIGESLRGWILEMIVHHAALADQECRGLIVALAGEDSVDMVTGRLPAAQHQWIDVVSAFNPWKLDEVRKFLEVNGVQGATEVEVRAIHLLLASGEHTLTGALALASGMVMQRGH